MTQSLTILGPNLSGKMQAKGYIHVHATGCGDIARQYDRRDAREAAAYASVQDLIEDFYSDFFCDEPDRDWHEFITDLYIAPCVKVPQEKEAS